MLKLYSLLSVLLLSVSIGMAQAIPEKFLPKKKGTVKDSPATDPVKKAPATPATPVVPQARTTASEPSEASVKTTRPKRNTRRTNRPKKLPQAKKEPLLQIVFTAEEDCLLQLNGESIGSLDKDKTRVIPLNAGKHTLLAQSKMTRELYNAEFTASRPNQLVIVPAFSTVAEELVQDSDLPFSPIEALEKQPAEPIRIEKVSVADPVPAYVSQNAIIQVAQEIADEMVPQRGGRFDVTDRRTPAKRTTRDSAFVEPFKMGKYEVTQQQWQSIMGYNNSANLGCGDCPVENITWNEVMTFIDRLNENGSVRFRLPTDSEWEYTVRLDEREYIDRRGGLRYGDYVAWYEKNAQRQSHPVGSKGIHRAGVHDLMGNVAEWCLESLDSAGVETGITEQVKVTRPGNKRLIRGGSFLNSDFIDRRLLDADDKQKTIGFRLVQY